MLFQVKTKCQQQQPPKLTQLVQQKKRLLLVASITTFSIVFLWFGNLFLLAEVVDSFNVTPTWQGFLLALPVLLMTLTTTIVGKYFINTEKTKLVHWSLLIIGSSMLVTAIKPKSFVIYGMVAIIAVGFGIGLPALNALVVGAVKSSHRGIITTFYGSIRALGSALGPIAFGFALDYGEIITLVTAGYLAIGSGLFIKLASNSHNLR